MFVLPVFVHVRALRYCGVTKIYPKVVWFTPAHSSHIKEYLPEAEAENSITPDCPAGIVACKP